MSCRDSAVDCSAALTTSSGVPANTLGTGQAIDLGQYQDSPDDAVLAYIVKNENTLGYLFKLKGNFHMGVLAGSVIRGGHSPMRGPVSIFPFSKIRKASADDFDDFHVSSEGYDLD